MSLDPVEGTREWCCRRIGDQVTNHKHSVNAETLTAFAILSTCRRVVENRSCTFHQLNYQRPSGPEATVHRVCLFDLFEAKYLSPCVMCCMVKVVTLQQHLRMLSGIQRRQLPWVLVGKKSSVRDQNAVVSISALYRQQHHIPRHIHRGLHTRWRMNCSRGFLWCRCRASASRIHF